MKKSSGYICIGRILDKHGCAGMYHLRNRGNGSVFMGENNIQELLAYNVVGNLDLDETGNVIVINNCGIDVEDVGFEEFSRRLSEEQLEMISILSDLGFDLDMSSIDGLNPFSHYGWIRSKTKNTVLGNVYLKIEPITSYCGKWLSCKYNIVIVTEAFEFNMVDVILNSPFKRTLMPNGIINIENYSEFKLRVERLGDGHNISKALDIAFNRSMEDLIIYNGQMGICSEYGYGENMTSGVVESVSAVFGKAELVYSVKRILGIWEDLRLYSLRKDLTRYETAFIIEHVQRLSKLNFDMFGEQEAIQISRYLYWFSSKLGVIDRVSNELIHRASLLDTERIMSNIRRDCTDGYFLTSHPDNWLLKCRYYTVLTGNKPLSANSLSHYRYYAILFNNPLFDSIKL